MLRVVRRLCSVAPADGTATLVQRSFRHPILTPGIVRCIGYALMSRPATFGSPPPTTQRPDGCASESDKLKFRNPLAYSMLALCLTTPVLAEGVFGPVISWPLIPIHMSLLPDGRVHSFGTDGSGNQTGQFIYDIWDPSLGTNADSHFVLPNITNTDIFCSSQTLLSATGKELIAGGDLIINGVRNYANQQATSFDSTTNRLESDGQIKVPRWYSSMIALSDETVMVLGGYSTQGSQSTYSITPESYDPYNTQEWKLLLNLTSEAAFGQSYKNWWYPRAYPISGGVAILTNDGKIFNISNTNTLSKSDQTIPSGDVSFPTVSYSPNHVLSIRGNSVVDINFEQDPPVVDTVKSPPGNRFWSNITILADGNLLLTGGSGSTCVTCSEFLTTAEYSSAIWNPITKHWSQDASLSVPRMYHSSGLLLLDGSVLVGGGGSPGPITNLNAEIYYPSYLFDAHNAPAVRPDTFWVLNETTDPIVLGYSHSKITRLTLVRAGSSTHSNNSDQRFIELSMHDEYWESLGYGKFWADLEDDPTKIIPGYYLMFAWNEEGTPSMGQMVHIRY